MTEQERKIWEAVKDIEKWAGQTYYTPTTDPKVSPDGDEVYQAIEKIKEALPLDLCVICGDHIEDGSRGDLGITLISDENPDIEKDMPEKSRMHLSCFRALLNKKALR